MKRFKDKYHINNNNNEAKCVISLRLMLRTYIFDSTKGKPYVVSCHGVGNEEKKCVMPKLSNTFCTEVKAANFKTETPF